jgi:nitric oxide reductase NorQ protein
VIRQFRVDQEPQYVEIGHEREVFRRAVAEQIPLLLKGPTGCGKTRFVERMAYELELPLITVSCHEDLSAADLVGRYLFRDNQTVWEDGPLTLAVRHGAICYLDEIVEARNDTTVIIHSLTDHRRILYIDKTQEVVHAAPRFVMVLSYNPGYQNITKDLKESTKQRFAALNFSYPPAALEAEILAREAGVCPEHALRLAEMAARIRNLKGFGLNEGVSTRLLVYAGKLMVAGFPAHDSCVVAIGDVLSDDPDVAGAVHDIIGLHFPAESGDA